MNTNYILQVQLEYKGCDTWVILPFNPKQGERKLKIQLADNDLARLLRKIKAKDNYKNPRSLKTKSYLSMVNDAKTGDKIIYVWNNFYPKTENIAITLGLQEKWMKELYKQAVEVAKKITGISDHTVEIRYENFINEAYTDLLASHKEELLKETIMENSKLLKDFIKGDIDLNSLVEEYSYSGDISAKADLTVIKKDLDEENANGDSQEDEDKMAGRAEGCKESVLKEGVVSDEITVAVNNLAGTTLNPENIGETLAIVISSGIKNSNIQKNAIKPMIQSLCKNLKYMM